MIEILGTRGICNKKGHHVLIDSIHTPHMLLAFELNGDY